MPPAGGHYRPNNVSNPYNQYPQQQHPQYPNSFNPPAFSGHGNFSTGHNHPMNIFAGGAIQNGTHSGGFGALPNSGGTGLASQEAQMRFAHGASLQRRFDAAGTVRGMAIPSRIREVWKDNMEQEFATIRSLVDKYPFISMDTEFPGIVARPMGNFPTKSDYHYQTLRCNVDLLKLIQLGITLWSPEGELPPAQSEAPLDRNQYSSKALCPCTWTFNFKFSLTDDMSSADSIEMLKKAGVDFEKCEDIGIDPKAFGARLVDSGLVLQDNITWLSFHSGYDFGYLVKLMFPAAMPKDDSDYLDFVQLWFRKIYDIKYLLRFTQNKARNGQLHQNASEIITNLGQRSGLQDLADELGCSRTGQKHTAGSDAWLTGSVFWEMRKKIFDGEVPDELVNKIWGLSIIGLPASAANQAPSLQAQTPNQNGATLFLTSLTPSTYTKPDAPSTPQSSHQANPSTPGQHQGFSGPFNNFLYGGSR